MYDNVVIGVDGHESGRHAAQLARSLAADTAHFTLVYVASVTPGARASNLELELADQEDLPSILSSEVRILGDRTELTRTYAGSIGVGLEGVAGQIQADLIVVGASERHGIARLLSGGDVTSVLHHTERAVAVAPRGQADHRRPILRIGVAVDDEPASEVALAHAGLLAEQLQASLIPFGVVEPRPCAVGAGLVAVPSEDPARAVAAARERLGRVARRPIEVVYGPIAGELDQFSERVDLLVCGSRRNGPMLRLLLGSTSDRLARHPRIPLLVAPPPR